MKLRYYLFMTVFIPFLAHSMEQGFASTKEEAETEIDSIIESTLQLTKEFVLLLNNIQKMENLYKGFPSFSPEERIAIKDKAYELLNEYQLLKHKARELSDRKYNYFVPSLTESQKEERFYQLQTVSPKEQKLQLLEGRLGNVKAEIERHQRILERVIKSN